MNDNLNNDTNELTEYERWLNSSECDDLAKAYENTICDVQYSVSDIIYGEIELHNNEEDNTYKDLEVIEVKDITKENTEYNKLDICIDFDNTLVDTNQAICDYYNSKTNSNIKVEDIKSYTLTETLTKWNKEQIDNIFCDSEFFQLLKPLNGAIDVINLMIESGHTVKIATCHNPKGIQLKYDYIQKNFPMINEIVFVVHAKGVKMDKSSIHADILIDDHISNLESANVLCSICFGDYNYNKDWKGYKIFNWKEKNRLMRIIDFVAE